MKQASKVRRYGGEDRVLLFSISELHLPMFQKLLSVIAVKIQRLAQLLFRTNSW